MRRQGDLFFQRGWDVFAFGLPGARSAPPQWSNREIGDGEAAASDTVVCSGEGHLQRFSRVFRSADNAARAVVKKINVRTFRRLARLIEIARVHLDPAQADITYWKLSERFAELYELARHQRVDIWLANDWTVLPIAQKLASEQGVPYAYDTHELAVDEYAERWRWRILQRPVIAALEKGGIAGAVVTSCVSQGIADRLHELYNLPNKPLLIRNMPQYGVHTFRPCGGMVEVLYHGVVSPGRGLEACIESVMFWRPEFRLTIRGPASETYRESLAGVARRFGVIERVILAPPVPMTDLVHEASRFDVGLFALPGHSKQNVHVLPNKFFEYTMAGLALCVSDLPEMTALLRQHDLGRSIPDVTPQAIAAAINGFDRASIDFHKRHALEAAKLLNWEAEADRLFAAIEQVVAGTAEARQVAAQ
ncbi:MAG: glycosyltransferase [Proteobacteria bacterium]|nr:glycosyltransferase [Pseudomonadota bacterium]